MGIRNYKKISELEAITSASLSTYVAGVDNGQTVRITLDVLADGVRNTINTIDIQRLNSLEVQTGSYLTSLNGTISGSSQLTSSYDNRYVVSGSITQTTWDNIENKPSGIVSQSTDLSLLNSFTSSQSTLNTAFTNGISGRLTTSSFNEYTISQSTSSLVDRLNTIESETGSYLTSLNGVISSSSQLTSSYDTRYTLSGSVQLLPSNLISSSTQISDFGFISSSHTDITSLNSFTASQSATNTAFTNGISARLQTSSFNEFTSSLTTSFPSKTIGSWTVPAGTSTQSFTVDWNHSYQMWVIGNIPNGIISWNATVNVTNANVPIVGTQYAWYYIDGNALVLTSIPNQIVGVNGVISTASFATTTSNTFVFGITNNSGTTQTINYGYVKIS